MHAKGASLRRKCAVLDVKSLVEEVCAKVGEDMVSSFRTLASFGPIHYMLSLVLLAIQG